MMTTPEPYVMPSRIQTGTPPWSVVIQPPGHEKLVEWTADGNLIFYLNGKEALRLTWQQVIQAVEQLLYPPRTMPESASFEKAKERGLAAFNDVYYRGQSVEEVVEAVVRAAFTEGA